MEWQKKKRINLFPLCGSYFYFVIKDYRNVFDIIKLPGLFLLCAFISTFLFCFVAIFYFNQHFHLIQSHYPLFVFRACL